MKLIGKGAFTKCYLKGCGRRVLLVSSDPIKECMSWDGKLILVDCFFLVSKLQEVR